MRASDIHMMLKASPPTIVFRSQ